MWSTTEMLQMALLCLTYQCKSNCQDVLSLSTRQRTVFPNISTSPLVSKHFQRAEPPHFQQVWLWLIPGTFTLSTGWTAEVIISGSRTSGSKQPVTTIVKICPRQNWRKGCSIKWYWPGVNFLQEGFEEEEILVRMTHEAIYHKVRPPSTIINCRTNLILKFGPV